MKNIYLWTGIALILFLGGFTVKGYLYPKVNLTIQADDFSFYTDSSLQKLKSQKRLQVVKPVKHWSDTLPGYKVYAYSLTILSKTKGFREISCSGASLETAFIKNLEIMKAAPGDFIQFSKILIQNPTGEIQELRYNIGCNLKK